VSSDALPFSTPTEQLSVVDLSSWSTLIRDKDNSWMIC
jgi:hypothetical protein